MGVWFDTENLTWNLPPRKLIPLVDLLRRATVDKREMTLQEVQVVHGKLIHVAQLSPALSLLIAETIEQMRLLLSPDHSLTGKTKAFSISPEMKHDLETVTAILTYTINRPLPIVRQDVDPGMWALKVYTDISGHLISNPSLGIYIPTQLTEQPIAASLAFPREFLLKEDKDGKKVFCKTTALEALGFLVTLCLGPLRFAEREAIFTNDNIATVIALKKGYSKDSWTTAIVRASRVVAAGIGCAIFATWERRRSSPQTNIADDLTHNLLTDLTAKEVDSYLALGQVSFPPPILQWMARPGPDQTLGYSCLIWLREEFPALRILSPSIV